MKKLLSVLLVIAMMVSMCAALTACGKDEETVEEVDNRSYTLNYAMSIFPTNWNPHIYETSDDSVILDYIGAGFYTFDYNDTMDGYEVVPYAAVSEPVDVTDQYVGQYGIEAGDTAKAYTIALREDLKWEDGTPITAADYVESAKLLLNPEAANYRADTLYSGNMVIYNAQNYAYSGQSVYLENAANAYYEMADLTLGDDGQYYTPDNEPVYFAVEYPLVEWLGGNTLGDYVYAYGDSYFDTTTWDALYALVDENGLVPMTDETYSLFAPVTTGNPAWGESEADLPAYFVYYGTYPEMDFEEVGMKATGDHELTIMLSKPLSGFYLLYSLTDSWLVNLDLYNECMSVENGVYTSSYGTSADTTMSYGPYKLTSFQSDKEFVLEKNDQFFAYNDEANKDLYQCTKVVYEFVPEASTRLEMFVNGQLDSYGLTADDMETYSMSDYCYNDPGDSTFAMVFNPDYDALVDMQAAAGENINKTIITLKEFRMAMSFAMDRAAFCLATSPTNSAAYAIYSNLIVSDPENGTAYRTTEQAKQVVVNFWDLADDIGAGKTYADIDEAIASITGYNLSMAQEYFDLAYDIAIEQGLMDEDDVVEIKIGTPNNTSTFYNNGYEYIVNNYTEAVKGTKLEGKLVFSRDDTLGNSFAEAIQNNQVDMLFGVGWTGSTLDPYGLMEAYTDAGYQYDPAWDTTTDQLIINIDGTDYTASVRDWNYAMTGETIMIIPAEFADSVSASDVAVEFSCGEADNNPELRLEILAALENAVLSRYDFIPLMDESSAVLKGAKINYGTEEYVFGMGHGGVKYYTFNFDDEAWDAFVADQGGSINYK